VIDPQKVPKKEWTWGDAYKVCGVHTFEGQLTWWERPHGHWCEAAGTQSFDEFLAQGAPVEAPPEVIREVEQDLRGASRPEGGARPEST
jgi:hypothetical protein